MSNLRFREHIRASIADPSLQAALDANAARRAKGRIDAFATLPDWQQRRHAAHRVRADVIDHLDRYLAEFGERLTANGMHVHRATDAAEAIGLVLELADRRERALIAKSKSMVSEEIELNRALDQHGHRVVETDLGEYIVQLRGEKPAHIITPAVHLRRHQVGELFQDKLGIPYTDDIPTLTAVARRVLREVFLTADIGVSGVNFGVVESGTLCIVTNEGNGRMVTTMPPVHIALMGMERLVPTLDDLALMLSLLPRSATGQKISVYTQLIQAPRTADEIDGARERHVIILDNGRSKVRDSGLREALYCIRCGACLNACPVFREIGGHAYVGSDGASAPYPGPIGSVISPGLVGLHEFGHLAQASSLCGACKDACPVDIDLPKLLTRVRAGESESPQGEAGVGLSALSRIGLKAYGKIGSSEAFFVTAQAIAAAGANLISPKSEWLRLPTVTGWGSSKDFPRPARRPFRKRWRARTDGQELALDKSIPVQEPDRASGQLKETAGASTDLAGRLASELHELGAHAERMPETSLAGQVMARIADLGAHAILAWDAIDGLDLDELRRGGIDLIRSPDPGVKVGLTGCTCAVAETGTIILAAGPGQPLGASLLPEVHIAVVKTSQIVRSLEEALQVKPVRDASSSVLISGPSRTADIEMTLTIGVHGPRELIVYIVE